MPPEVSDAVQQWNANTAQAMGQALVDANVVGRPGAATGLSSPLLFGRNGNLGANTFLRLAGNVSGGGNVGYPVSPGTVVTYFQAQATVAPTADFPLVLVINGVDDPTSIVLPAGSRAIEVALNIPVADSGTGVGTLTVRSGATSSAPVVDLSVSVWTQEQES